MSSATRCESSLYFETVRVTRQMMTLTAEEGIAYANVTRLIERAVKASGVLAGMVFAFVRHTTAMLVINEDEKGLVEHDFPRAFRRLFPKGFGVYAHDRPERLRAMPGEPANGEAHCIAFFCGRPFIVIPLVEGALLLGTWQSALLFDLDCRHHAERAMVVVVQGARK